MVCGLFILINVIIFLQLLEIAASGDPKLDKK